MSFIIQRATGRGYALTQIRGDVLRIGRGTNAELRSENPAVALEHAVIETNGSEYTITDKGSITGTYVNRRPVETARLAKGDVIEIGDLRIDVQMVDPGKPLLLRVAGARQRRVGTGYEEEEEAIPAAAVAAGSKVVRAPKLDYASAYRLTRPWLTKISLTALVLIIALAVVGEVIRPERQKLFMPGGLSSAHARAQDAKGRVVAEQCNACHTPWKSVVNDKCLGCHPQQPHAEHEASTPDCFTCHSEHRGMTKLSQIADTTCTSCHSDLGGHVKPAAAALAAVRFGGGRYSFASIEKIASFGEHPDFQAPRDIDTLAFNHKVHLVPGGVFNAQGKREVLACNNCHELVTTKGKSDPIVLRFDQHCQRCHRLTFDARFPNAEVPHGGDPGLVYGFVLATYAGDANIAGKPPEEVRRILTARRAATPDERAVLNAEQVIKTKCQKCHQIERRNGRLAAVPPVIRREWFTSARFTHGTHRTIACEECHHDVRRSSATSDVLMPRRNDCTDCHAPNAKRTQAASTCVTCHAYHLRPQRSIGMAALIPGGESGLGSGGRMLQAVLLVVIVVLVIVVLVPVGIALYRKVMASSPAPRAAAPQPPARPVPPPMPDAAAAQPAPRAPQAPQTPPTPAPQLAAEPPRPAPPPAADATMFAAPAAPAQQGTEMVQWYGMLNCTSGELEGKRFIVEDEGVYIGRDPSLCSIVINDSRISKRHVRIVPRNGRVWAIDQDSTNGTFLGKADSPRITEVQLKRGDTLILADNAATFIYQI